MKNLVVLFGFFACIHQINAQNTYIEDSIKKIGNSFSMYAELGGTGGIFSINGDIVKPMNELLGIAVRGGITYNEHWYLLSEINALLGVSRNYFEFGVGGSFYSFERVYTEELFRSPVILYRLGYRYQGETGFLFRPALLLYSELSGITPENSGIWLGFSFGYTFNTKPPN